MALAKSVNSILRAGRILRSLSQGVTRVTDLSRDLGLTKGTTFRLLSSLESAGLVSKDPTNRQYYVGPLIVEIGSQPIISHQNLIICAAQEMKYLRDLVDETVVIFIRTGIEKLCLEELQSKQALKYSSGKGVATPIYTGSAGKVLLSELQDNELQLLLGNIDLVPMGPNTITLKEVLIKELVQIRKQGYAISFGERIPHSGSISVPVKGYVCAVALGILGPDNRFPLNVMLGVLEEMRNCASRISKKLIEAT